MEDIDLEKEAILSGLRELWQSRPGLRFLQLALAVCPYEIDLFHVTDEDFLSFINKFLGRENVAANA